MKFYSLGKIVEFITYICVYVFVYVFIYLYLYVYLYICICICISMYTCIVYVCIIYTSPNFYIFTDFFTFPPLHSLSCYQHLLLLPRQKLM